MKTMRLFLAVFAVLFVIPTVGKASTAVSPKEARENMIKKSFEDGQTIAVDAKELEKASKKMKRATKLAKFFGMGKAAEKVDFNDPVDKWMWFWIFGWGIGLLLSILSPLAFYGLWYISYLFWTAGTVCLIIWLLKKFGGM